MFASMAPGLDIKPLLAELKARAAEELDYLTESQSQRQFAAAYEGDDDFVIPHVLAAAPMVVVSEWLEGYSLARVIAEGTQEERDHFGTLYLRFLMSGPLRAGLLHADPHPGNYRVMADGRLGILDFGAVARLPDGPPAAMGHLLRIATAGDAEAVVAGLREEGFIKQSIAIDGTGLLSYLAPFLEPARHTTWRFSRPWMRELFGHVRDPRRPSWSVGLKLNLPPEYLLIHRVWLGGVAVLCQIEGEVPVLEVLAEWLPEFDVTALPYIEWVEE